MNRKQKNDAKKKRIQSLPPVKRNLDMGDTPPKLDIMQTADPTPAPQPTTGRSNASKRQSVMAMNHGMLDTLSNLQISEHTLAPPSTTGRPNASKRQSVMLMNHGMLDILSLNIPQNALNENDFGNLDLPASATTPDFERAGGDMFRTKTSAAERKNKRQSTLLLKTDEGDLGGLVRRPTMKPFRHTHQDLGSEDELSKPLTVFKKSMTLSRHLGSLSSLGDSEDGTQKRRSKQNLAEIKPEGPEIITDGDVEEVDEKKSAMAQLGNVFIKANLSRRLSGNLSQPESSEMDSGLSSTTPLASSMNLSTTLSGVNIKLKRVNTLGSSSSIESRANSLKKVPSTRSLRTMRANRVSKSGTLLLDSEQNEEDDQFLDEFKKENNIETISKRSTSKSSIMLETPENEIIESKTEDFVILSESNHETVPEKSKLDVIGSEASSAESEDEAETETVEEADTQRESADILSTDVELPGIEDESESESDDKEEEEAQTESQIPNHKNEIFENDKNDDENRIVGGGKVDIEEIELGEKNFDLNNVPLVLVDNEAVDTDTINNLVRGDENQVQSGALQLAILQSDAIDTENMKYTVEASTNSQMEESLAPPKTELNDKNSVTKRVSAVIGKGLFGIFGSVLDSLGLKTDVEVAKVENPKEDEISIDDVESDMFFQKDDSSWSHASPATDNNSPVLVEVSPTIERKIAGDDIQSNQLENLKEKDPIDSKPIPTPVSVSDGQTENFELVLPTGNHEQAEVGISAQSTKIANLMVTASGDQAVNEKEVKAVNTPAAGKGKGKSRSKSPKSKQNNVLLPPTIAEKNDIPSINDPKISNATNKLNLSTEIQPAAPSSQQPQTGLKEGINRRKSKKEKSKQHAEKKSTETEPLEQNVVAKVPEKPLIPKPKATVQKEAPKIVSMSPAAKASLPNLTSIIDSSKATDPPKVTTKSTISSASNITAKSKVDSKNEPLKQKEDSKTALSSKKKEKGKVDKKGASKEKEFSKADTTKEDMQAKNEQTTKKDSHPVDVNKAAAKPAIVKQEMTKKDDKVPPKVIPKGKEREPSVEKKVKAKSKTTSTTPSITETAKKTDSKVKEPEILAQKTIPKSSVPSEAPGTPAKVSSDEKSKVSVAIEKKDSIVAPKVDAKKTKKSKSKNQRTEEEKKQKAKENTEVLNMAKVEVSPEAITKEEIDTGVVNGKEASEIIDNKPSFIEEINEMQIQSESLVAQPEVTPREENIIPPFTDTKIIDSIQVEYGETGNTIKEEVKEESLLASESGIETLVVASRPQKAVYQPPEVDFSDIFHEWLGQKRGLFAFRIENFIPTLQVQPGMFCVADSYIILCTTKEDGQYFNQIYTWIGSESATDKMFCCAMYAVALRNQTNASSKILRQTQGNEDEEFLELFEVWELLDSSYATNTALNAAQEKEYEICMYRMIGAKGRAVEYVPNCSKTLDTDSAFVLDAGLNMFLYIGEKSSMQNRLRGRLLLNRINQQERVGKANIIEVMEEEKEHLFMDYLNVAEDCDHDHSMRFITPVELFKLDNVLHSDIVAHACGVGELTRNLLDTKSYVALDMGSEIFLWAGKDVDPKSRDLSSDFFAKVIKSKPRPSWLAVRKLVEGAEPEVFQLAFKDWNAVPVKQEEEKPAQSPPTKMDIDTLYMVPVNNHPDMDEINLKMQIVNNYLVTFSTFVFQKGKFMPLPERERGHFFSNDAYIFLCVYRAVEEDLYKLIDHSIENPETPDISDEYSDEDDIAMHCVVYFCQSARASKVAHSTFKLSTQKELEALISEKFACPFTVEIVEYGREPFALLAHLENDYVMHNGSRTKAAKDPTTFYQIRTDFRYGSTRAYEVKIDELVQTSIDCLYIQSLPDCFLCKGDNVKSSAFDAALELSQRIYNFHTPKAKESESATLDPFACSEDSQVDKYDFRIIDGSNIPEDLIKLIGPKSFAPIHVPNIRPRFFECSTKLGYFGVERMTHFTQKNLFPESCVIIDLGNPDPVFFWIGANASEQIIKFSRYCMDLWLATCQDGRSMNDGMKRLKTFRSFQIAEPKVEAEKVFITVHQGKEPPRFKAFFQGWDDYLLDVNEPGSLFSREAAKKPIQKQPVSQ